MGQWQSQPVCTSPACLHASSYILENLAPNWEQMDPCTEFDQSEWSTCPSKSVLAVGESN
jgi:hypothetical protein